MYLNYNENEALAKEYINSFNNITDIYYETTVGKKIREISLTEAYIGKTPTLLEAEGYLDQLMQLMKEDPTKDYTNHPLNVKFCKALNKEFKFKKLHITWKLTPKGAPMICTFKSFDNGFRNKAKELTDKGYKNGRNHVAFIIVNAPIVQYDITPAEYMAIILHEIGHNFDISWWSTLDSIIFLLSITETIRKLIMNAKILKKVSTAENMDETEREKVLSFYIQNTLGLVTAATTAVLASTNIGKRILATADKISEKLADLPIIRLYKVISFQILKIFDAVSTIIKPILILGQLPYRLLHDPINQFINLGTRKGEQFADSFATMYGYGEELSVALDKIGSISGESYIFKETGPMKLLADLYKAEHELIGAMNNCHGNTIDRTTNNIKYLKAELKSQKLDPELRREIELKIEQLEELNKKFMTVKDDDSNMFTATVRKILFDAFKGDTGIIAKLFPDNYA